MMDVLHYCFRYCFRLKSPRFQDWINSDQAAGLKMFIGGTWPRYVACCAALPHLKGGGTGAIARRALEQGAALGRTVILPGNLNIVVRYFCIYKITFKLLGRGRGRMMVAGRYTVSSTINCTMLCWLPFRSRGMDLLP
jgi:hypothetical protein